MKNSIDDDALPENVYNVGTTNTLGIATMECDEHGKINKTIIRASDPDESIAVCTKCLAENVNVIDSDKTFTTEEWDG